MLTVGLGVLSMLTVGPGVLTMLTVGRGVLYADCRAGGSLC